MTDQYLRIAQLADTYTWPCRRHKPEGCDNCTSCLMISALWAVGLGVGLKKGTPG